MRLLRQASGLSTSLIGPDSIRPWRTHIRAGSAHFQTLYAKYLPSHVEPGFLAALYCHPGEIDIALHVEPLPNQVAIQRLKRQRARHESTLVSNRAHGRLTDPEVEAAARSAQELMSSVAAGEERLFHAGLYITVRGQDFEQLDDEVARIAATCASLGVDLRPVEFLGDRGWKTTLPLATDEVGRKHIFDTKSLACLFPFVSGDITHSRGILYGRNPSTGGVIMVDRFSLDNYNQVVLAHSGKGKSYFAKLQVLRSLYKGIDALVVDPENEYVRLAEAVGGTAIRLGPQDRLNPLDLAHAGEPDALIEQSLFVHALVESLLEKVPQVHRAALDRALAGAYAAAGVTPDPRTHSRPAPVFADVIEALRGQGDDGLASRLEPLTRGSYEILFGGPTSAKPEGHLVVFSLRDLPDEIKAAATMLVLDSVWKRVASGERKRRLVVVDEAWLLLKSESGTRFLERLARSARKYWCGLTTITQDVRDALGTDIGRTVVTNASSQVLFGQHPQGLDSLAEAFSLSKGERSYLASCSAGRGLVCAGSERAMLEVVASQEEHRLVTTSPEFLATVENSEANRGG